MIIVNIMGGLGNQMFQYAAARALAVKNRTKCRLQIFRFDRCRPNKDHTYQLDNFRIKAQPATRWDIAMHRIRSVQGTQFARGILSRLRSDTGSSTHNYFYSESSGSAYKENILAQGSNVYLTGYFNSYKYFDNIRHLLLQELAPKAPISSKGQELLAMIANCHSVGVHVRRGDYVTNPHVRRDVEGIITRAYYENAFHFIEQRVQRPHFFFFSNDIEWVKNNLQPPGAATYVDFNPPQRGFEDLWLMSRCKHNITAGGSTFSWWASYLNPEKDGLVVRTQRTSSDPLYNNPTDYFPSKWHSVTS